MSAAVEPARSRFAASGNPSEAGLANTSAAGTVTDSAQPPLMRKARTSSPTAPPPDAIRVSGPTADRTPATSYPMAMGRSAGSPWRVCFVSAGFMPAARTAIVTSPGPGAGTSVSTDSRTSLPPNRGATQCFAMGATVRVAAHGGRGNRWTDGRPVTSW